MILRSLFLGLGLAALVSRAEDLRIGIIGCDTSHVIAFTKLINDPKAKDHVAGGKVVAAFKGGSPDVESSSSRVEGYTKQLRDEFGVIIVDSIDELCQQVDAVLLESVDGRPHLEQVKPVLKARKPVFIDKPIAASLRDTLEIFRLAQAGNVPVFSASSYRFYESVIELKKADTGKIRGALSYGPAHLEAHHPDLFWYGIHPTEALFTVMGTGCQSVVRTSTPDTDIVTGTWSDGRVGTLIGLHSDATPSKVIVFGKKSVVEQKGSGSYAPLVVEIMKFFKSGVAPVSSEETIEIFAFMEAADESKRQNGRPVKISDVISAARKR
jgi:hypothetical protein